VRGERDARETEKGRDSRKQKDGQTEKSAMDEVQRERKHVEIAMKLDSNLHQSSTLNFEPPHAHMPAQQRFSEI